MAAVITINQLTRCFKETTAVDRLSLEVHVGEIFGFLGHNGAGKTTTVRLLNGVIEPTSGGIRVLGLDPQVDGPALRARTGVLTETPSMDERLTAWDNSAIYADLYGVPRADVRKRIDECWLSSIWRTVRKSESAATEGDEAAPGAGAGFAAQAGAALPG